MADVQRYAADLARDLGAPERETPIASVIAYADEVIEGVRDNVRCTQLSGLLGWVADRLAMQFVLITSDEQLAALREEFGARKEFGFHEIARDIQSPTCFGATFRLQHPQHGIRFVAVIDARGAKGVRRYFTKCHEVAHILLLTDQRRLVYRRTHEERHHPEEQLVDRIAARLAFYPPLLQAHFAAPLHFALMKEIISDVCPEASWDSAARGIIRAWPQPAARIRAQLRLKPSEAARRPAGLLPLTRANGAKLRLTTADTNEHASRVGVHLFEHMRVPETSIIASVFNGAPEGEAIEDLSAWETGGRSLPALRVRVIARRAGRTAVEAILVAEGTPTPPAQ